MSRMSTLFAVALAVVLALLVFVPIPEASGQADKPGLLVFDEDGQLNVLPLGSWRTWPFLGTPLTPNDMNKGEAPFPEFHHVYMDPASYKAYAAAGVFPEGTVIVKELVTTQKRKKASSGRGYFEDRFNGLEIAHKSKERYPDEPGNWAYYTFGHHAPPYAAKTTMQPTENCASCHENMARDDMVFTQYYPNLRAVKPAK